MSADPVPLTADQRRAIEATGRDLCVVAGAGTGKTFVLTRRLVRRVVADRVDLSRVLAITFTEKAAGEMRDRLARALEESGRPAARQEVEAASISTVHAFCARLLREHAVAARVDPGFAVLDEVESDRLLREALDRLTDRWREESPDDFAVLAELGGDDPAETLLAVYREAQSSGGPVGEFVRRVEGLPPVGDVTAPLRAAVGALRPLAGTGTAAAQRNVGAALEAAASLPDGDDEVARLESAVAAIDAAVKLNCGAPAKPALAAVRETARAALAVLAEHALSALRETLARAVETLDDVYAAAKGRGERLDFADLERDAVSLLERRPDVRDEVRARRPEVLVDEFQDTNPVQARLVDLLRTPGRLFVVGDPRQAIYGFRGADVSVFDARIRSARPDDGVVDLRHSFRSRPEVLRFVNRVFAAGFESADGGAALASDLVAGRDWPAAAAPCVEVRVAPVESMPLGRADEAAWIASRIVGLVESETPVAAPTADEPLRTRPCEFGDVAVLLRATTHVKILEQALVAADVPYLVVKGRGFFRAREVIDVAHLLACVENPRDDLAMAAVLRSPSCGLSDDGLFSLCAARAEGDAVADVVDRWTRGATDLADLAPADAAALRRFATAFGELRARRGTDGVAVLVDRAFDRLRLDVLALGRPNGRQRAANLRKVRTRARAADADGLSLAEFVEELKTLREREVREAEAAVAGGARGAVSVMTVHAAKGLEFPVVFVPDLGRTEVVRGGRIVAGVGRGLGLRGRAGAGHDAQPWAYARLLESRRAAEAAESQRLLYVACTRASDRLLLSGALREGGDGDASRRPWWALVSEALGRSGPSASPEGEVLHLPPPGGRDASESAVVRLHGVRQTDVQPASARTLLGRVAARVASGFAPPLPLREEARQDAAALLDEAARSAPAADGTPFATNVSALLAFGRCPQEYRLRYVVGVPDDGAAGGLASGSAPAAFDLDEAPPPASLGPDGGEDGSGDGGDGGDEDGDAAPSSRAVGRAAHAALERLVPAFRGDPLAEVTVALRAETAGRAPDPAAAARIVTWIEALRASPLGREVAAAARSDVRREQPFLLAAGRTAVRGQIDLLFRAADGDWTVVDYKTGALATARRGHELQMRLYALGVRAAVGRAPTRLVLWSLPRAAAVEVRADASDLARTEALLDDFSARTAAGGLGPRDRPPCADCTVRAACGFAPR